MTGCARDKSSDAQPADGTTLAAEPEPAHGRQALRDSCTQPVVRFACESAGAQGDTGPPEVWLGALVHDHPEFRTPQVHYAEAQVAGKRCLLARCPNAELANRLTRSIRDFRPNAAPKAICGFAASGWTFAKRRVAIPDR